MAYLIFILVTILLLASFLVLSNYEVRRGTRVFARQRAYLDGSVERAEFILTHVDFAAFLQEEARNITRYVAHYVAHFSLQAVRAAERLLTNIVRRLRAGRDVETTPRENAREFVRTLSDFKGHLEATRPEIPDVLD